MLAVAVSDPKRIPCDLIVPSLYISKVLPVVLCPNLKFEFAWSLNTTPYDAPFFDISLNSAWE